MQVVRGHDFFMDMRFPFFINRYIIRKGEHIPSHTHDFVELVYVVSGDATHEMSGNSYRLAPGEVFIIEPQTYHSYTSTETEETVVYNVLFDVEFLRDELAIMEKMPSFVDFFYLTPFLRKSAAFIPYSRLREAQILQILNHLQKMQQELADRKEGYQLIIKTRWIECLVLLGRFHHENNSRKPSLLTDRQRMESIRHLVEQNFRQPLSLEQLSRISGMSVSSFTAKFKEAVGVSLVDHKHTFQIGHAKQLLTDTNAKVVEIAYDSGFNDISFFNKIFRKHTGLTPKEFRKQVRS